MENPAALRHLKALLERNPIEKPTGKLYPNCGRRAPVKAKDRQRTLRTMAGTVTLMRSVVDLVELRRRIQDRLGFDHQLGYRRPVAAFLAGELEQARAMLDQQLGALGARTDMAAADFRRFAESLRGRLPPP